PGPPPRRRGAPRGRTESCRGDARRATRRRPAACRHRRRRAFAPPRQGPRETSLAARLTPVFSRQRLGEVVELALQEPVELVDGQLDAVVGDPALGEVVGADLLGPLARPDLRVAGGVTLGALALELALVEARANDPHRLLSRLPLTTLVPSL